MSWIYFPVYALITAIFWIVGTSLIYASNQKSFLKPIGHVALLLGIASISTFVVLLWIELARPPMRTLGETRLWYALFLFISGYLTFVRWGYQWVLILIFIFASLFLTIDLLHPETYEKTLMPALQSPWFIPHVIVYIFAYAMLGFSWLFSIYGLYMFYRKNFQMKILNVADNLVYIGFAFLTLGLLFGALWAKKAWGHYWTWDPKETWAFLTWLAYLIYIHTRYFHYTKVRLHLWMLSFIFIVLLLCWFGINYMPSAQNSVHVYAN
jgi:ABC-type transport system involved in cytochrome c biogenesis permease subunit